jgi:hypothetical protein
MSDERARRAGRAIVPIAMLAMAVACSPDTDWRRWELQDPPSGAFGRAATFALTWDDSERTRGKYHFTLALKNRGDGQEVAAWAVQGMVNAEPLSPDFCGRAKWSSGSTCTRIKLWPDGDLPPDDVQEQIDRLGLPDRKVSTFLMFRDGQTDRVSLVREADKATETSWLPARPTVSNR